MPRLGVRTAINLILLAFSTGIIIGLMFSLNITNPEIRQSHSPISLEEMAMLERLRIDGKKIDEMQEEREQNQVQKTNKNTFLDHNLLTTVPGHEILSFDDQTFRKKPLDEMMSTYGPTRGGPTCDIDFGMGLVNKWRNLKSEYCKPHELGDTSFNCYFIQQRGHSGAGDQLCLLENVQFNFHELNDPKVTDNVMMNYVKTHHNDEAYVHFNPGLISGTCSTVANVWKQDHFPGWNADIVFNGLKQVTQLKCDQWINHSVLILQRHTFANFYHDSEDFINAFLSMSILQWNSDDTQIWITDLYPQGPFWPVWSKAFSGKYPAMLAWDIKKKFGDQNICFRKAAVGIYGPAAPITVISSDTNCLHSNLVRSYADFIIRGLNLHHKTYYAHQSPPNYITVTWMARRSSTIWPEKRFCSSNSFFKCDLWDHLSTRKLGRVVKNDDQIVAKLKELESVQLLNHAKIIVRDVDYNLLSFEEQIEIDITTDIMIGPHGAGLTHNIFMPDHAHLIELWVDGSSGNRHFHNLAFWQGRNYQGISTGNPVNPEQVYQLVLSSAQKIDMHSF